MTIYQLVSVTLTVLLIKGLLVYVSTGAQTIFAEKKLCGNITCFNKAKCRNDSTGIHGCVCQLGYTGKNCEEDLEECKFGNPCYRRGHCNNTIGSYKCECLEGWTGEDVHCEVKDNSTTDHGRKCMPGWTGEWCQDQCLNDSMCRATEVCKKRGRGLRCVCATGWRGIKCTADIDECTRSPCPSNTICVNTQGSYKCSCPTGWTGLKCDIDINECLINPCKHSSTCINALGYYNCTCSPGWKGRNCDEDIDECAYNPCKNSLQCNNHPGLFSCLEKQQKGMQDEESIYMIAGSITNAVMLVICVILLVFVKHKRKLAKCNAVDDDSKQ